VSGLDLTQYYATMNGLGDGLVMPPQAPAAARPEPGPRPALPPPPPQQTPAERVAAIQRVFQTMELLRDPKAGVQKLVRQQQDAVAAQQAAVAAAAQAAARARTVKIVTGLGGAALLVYALSKKRR
jgi:hypothetical protein